MSCDRIYITCLAKKYNIVKYRQSRRWERFSASPWNVMWCLYLIGSCTTVKGWFQKDTAVLYSYKTNKGRLQGCFFYSFFFFSESSVQCSVFPLRLHTSSLQVSSSGQISGCACYSFYPLCVPILKIWPLWHCLEIVPHEVLFNTQNRVLAQKG